MEKKGKIDLDSHLTEFGLTVRNYNFLMSTREVAQRFPEDPLYKLVTVRDLCRHTRRDLQKFRNVGRKSIAGFENILDRYGLRFGMSDEELAEYEGKPLKKDEPQEKQEEDSINWEERRWGLVAMNMPDEVDYNGRWKRIFDKTIYIADEWIKMYKKQLEKELSESVKKAKAEEEV